jgi:hypothetical protein
MVKESYAYIGTYELGMAIVDITNPASPGEPVFRDQMNHTEGFWIDEQSLFVACNWGGLAIWDLHLECSGN